jgi:hypothetical protein
MALIAAEIYDEFLARGCRDLSVAKLFPIEANSDERES